MTPDALVGRALIGVARLWQAGPSAMMGPTCRYTPSCSAYAIEAWSRYGAARGSWLAARRFCRCHPLGGYGYDPVPVLDTTDTSDATVSRGIR